MKGSIRRLVVLAVLAVVAGVAVGMTVSQTPVSNNADGVILNEPGGPAVNLTGNTDIYNSSGSVSTTAVRWETADGSATFSSPGDTEATVATTNLTGAWTTVTAIDATAANLTIDPADKAPVTVGENIDTVSFPDASAIAVDDGNVDFTYSGSSGTSIVEFQGLPAETTVLAADADSEAVLGTNTTTQSGVGAFRLSNSEHDVLLQTSDGDPILSDPRPRGDQTQPPTELSVAVDDPDFPNDSLNVTFYLDGSKVGSTTATSAGRASVTIAEPSRGTHQVRALARDSYGQETNLSWSMGVPDTLTARNVSNPSEVIDGQEVTFTFYQPDGSVDRRTTTNGSVPLKGLNTTANIVVSVEASGTTGTNPEPAYHIRQFIIQDISDQQAVYLLPESSTSLFNIFELVDRTGNFDPTESKLIIQRALNISGNTRWKSVAGGDFGAVNEYSTFLAQDVQYRLIVENRDDDQRIVGDYVARNEDNPKTITLKSIVVDRPSSASQWGTTWISDTNETDGNKTLWFSYNDSSANTTDVSVTVHERNNEANVLTEFDLDNFGQSATYSTTISGDQLNKTWMVDWTARNASGAVVASGNEPVGRTGQVPLPIDSEWLWRMVLVAIPIIAALASERIATIGAMGTVAVVGVLMILGWAQVSFVLWLAAAIIAVGGHAFHMRTQGASFG